MLLHLVRYTLELASRVACVLLDHACELEGVAALSLHHGLKRTILIRLELTFLMLIGYWVFDILLHFCVLWWFSHVSFGNYPVK